jgi:hypothetical protein
MRRWDNRPARAHNNRSHNPGLPIELGTQRPGVQAREPSFAARNYTIKMAAVVFSGHSKKHFGIMAMVSSYEGKVHCDTN